MKLNFPKVLMKLYQFFYDKFCLGKVKIRPSNDNKADKTDNFVYQSFKKKKDKTNTFS